MSNTKLFVRLKTLRKTIQNKRLYLKFIILRAFSDKEFHRFRCNICGKFSTSPLSEIKGRESPSCSHCGSTLRFRSIAAILSNELFGKVVPISDFPECESIAGIGMSDSDIYAVPLSKNFSYKNTYYHREPRLDITSLAPEMHESAHFVISSEVFEHVPRPVDIAFENLFKLLKTGGICIFSVPYNKDGTTKEHFPELFEYSIIQKNGKKVLVNKTKDGVMQLFKNLRFHGGRGATLEMRTFSESSLTENITASGFNKIKFHNEDIPEYGIFNDDQNQLILSFRKI